MVVYLILKAAVLNLQQAGSLSVKKRTQNVSTNPTSEFFISMDVYASTTSNPTRCHYMDRLVHKQILMNSKTLIEEAMNALIGVDDTLKDLKRPTKNVKDSIHTQVQSTIMISDSSSEFHSPVCRFLPKHPNMDNISELPRVSVVSTWQYVICIDTHTFYLSMLKHNIILLYLIV